MIDWTAQSVLITGGTGSLGRALVEELLERRKVKRLVVFSRDELKQHDMRSRWPQIDSSPIRYMLGDVRDRTRLARAFDDVDVVIHAAALKQIDTAEYNPWECAYTNVIGTQNVIEAAIDANVAKVMLTSTDKAVMPETLYGFSKATAERLIVQGNVYAKHRFTRLSAVRYGNVFGSRGSVARVFREQIARGGPITVTDPEATRFWITLPQAVEFVLSSIEIMEGGEVFIPKLHSSTIGELVDVVAEEHGGMPVDYVGLRPSEKKHEALVAPSETVADLGDRYAVRLGGVPAPTYRSDTAPRMPTSDLVALWRSTAS